MASGSGAMVASPDSGSELEWVILLDVVEQPTQNPWLDSIPHKHNWFAIESSLNLNDAKANADARKQKVVNSSELNCPIKGMSICLPDTAAVVPVDSTIYVIGGLDDEILGRHVWVTHLSKSSSSPSIVCDKRRWSNCKWLKHQRSVRGSCAVIQDGVINKIFVFGGMWARGSRWGTLTNSSYYAEVYDLDKKKWDLVKGLPLRDEWMKLDVPMTVVVEWPWCRRRRLRRGGRTIILLYIRETKALYYYNPHLDTSDVFDPDFATKEGTDYIDQIVPVTVAPAHSKKPTTLLYCVMSIPKLCCLQVYDLATKTWLGTVTGFGAHHLPDYTKLNEASPVHLVSLGSRGSLCALWSINSGFISEPLVIRCVKFSIQDGQPLSAVIESCTDYIIPDGWRLSECVPVKVKAEACEKTM